MKKRECTVLIYIVVVLCVLLVLSAVIQMESGWWLWLGAPGRRVVRTDPGCIPGIQHARGRAF